MKAQPMQTSSSADHQHAGIYSISPPTPGRPNPAPDGPERPEHPGDPGDGQDEEPQPDNEQDADEHRPGRARGSKYA